MADGLNPNVCASAEIRSAPSDSADEGSVQMWDTWIQPQRPTP